MSSGLQARLPRRLCVALAPAVCALAALVGAQPASAQAPYWKVSSRSAPLYLPLSEEQLFAANDQAIKGEGAIIALATNLGNESAAGSATAPVVVTDQLPPGLEPTGVHAASGLGVPGGEGKEQPMTCTEPFKENKVVCKFEKPIPAFEHLELRISVKSKQTEVPKTEAEDPLNVITVTGAGAPEGKVEQKLKFGADEEVEENHEKKKVSRTHFGVEQYEFTPETEQGQPDTQAGSHPYQLTSTFYLNQTYGFAKEFQKALPQAPALQKNLSFRIPAGVLGNPGAVPQCPSGAFGVVEEGGINGCADNTAIGVATVTFYEPITLGLQTWSVPVFNIVPSPGEPAKFGFEIVHVPVVLDTSLRTGEDYGVTVNVKETSEAVQVLGAQVTLWGTPGESSHDEARGWACLGSRHYTENVPPPRPECGKQEFSNPNPFLILPTSCAAPLASETTGNAWSGESFMARNEPPWAPTPPVALTGCQNLPFNPSLSVTPDTSAGSTPAGMTVEVSLPQKETTMVPSALGEADIRETTLALPEGVQASAGAANGLGACGTGESGLLGQPLQEGFAQQFTAAIAGCPDAAKIGSVEIETPLLPHTLTGSLYLGTQNTNPFASPLVVYLIATEEEPVHHEWSKVLVKLAGEIRIDPNTGQLVSRFKDTPQAPFEHLRIHLLDGARASQATPARCGTYTASAQFTPWPEGVAAAERSASFNVEQSCSGPGPLPFAPSFQGGATNTQAGAFTPFVITLGHRDGDQALTGLSMHLPQGAAAMLASVTPCPVALADTGQCPPSSLIGHSLTSSGLGGSPVSLGGEAFLTESLGAGIPFGVSVKTPAEHVGPFNIGTIIANSAIQVDPNTAAATITAQETRIIESNGNTTIPSSPLPTMIKGVPVQLKQVIVSVDRPNFEFNPTDCSGHSVTGAATAISDTLTGAEGASVTQQTPYAVTGCGGLNFTPKLTASVSGQGSKASGVTFSVVVEAARGQANIAKTDLQLPIVLPSRLTTIQQACLLATFEKNPASCPEGSNIGFAVAHTPVLRKPLQGPAYLVSHGNAAFPDVEFVLQGEGILLVLDGKTDIKKPNGAPCSSSPAPCITFSKFETVPDAPVERFETVLPAGPHSALTANVPESDHFSLCKHESELMMATEITGQNGAVIKQSTKVALTGCVLGHKEESKLSKALKACRKKFKHSAHKRAACERAARKKYAGKHAKKKKH